MADYEKISNDEYIQISMYIPEKIRKCIDLLAYKYLKDTNLKAYYVPYILELKKNDGLSQKDFKETIPFDKSRISVVIHELIDNGLVYNDGRGRNSSLHLTTEGNATYPACKMFVEILKKEIFQLKPEDEELLKRKNIEFNQHLDEVIKKLSETENQ